MNIMKGNKSYMKWLFTRWYLYIIAFFLSHYSYVNSGGIATAGSKITGEYIGFFFSYIIQTAIAISVIYWLRNKFKKK